MNNERAAEIVKKFKGKILKEFLPSFLLNQMDTEKESVLEYEDFDTCMDEYFS